MIKVLFVCHGNICRSTMAQFVFQDMINRQNLADKFLVDSKATSTEEIGNGPHYGTVQKLREVGVPVLAHRASQLRRRDYEEFDYLIGMDHWNMKNMLPDRRWRSGRKNGIAFRLYKACRAGNCRSVVHRKL